MCEGECYREPCWELFCLVLPRTATLVSADEVRTLTDVLSQFEQVAVAEKERGQNLALATQTSTQKTELKIQ